jgi:hypothetical protein
MTKTLLNAKLIKFDFRVNLVVPIYKKYKKPRIPLKIIK